MKERPDQRPRMDQRLVIRRREVAEGRARSGLSRLFLILALASMGGVAAWLFRSPVLSVHEIVVSGASPQLAEQVRAGSGIVPGEPLVGLRPARIEAELRKNPWVATADVSILWPTRVLIEVTPRLPVAWLGQAGQWALVGVDAVVLEKAGQAGNGFPRLVVEAGENVSKLGGLAFLSELGPLQNPGAVVEQKGSELWANVSGYTIRLGRPIDMEAKARALLALLGRGLEAGATISLLAPTRPAVIPGNVQAAG